jgi:aconitate hydratase
VDSLRTRDAVLLGGRRWQLHRLDRLGVDRLPFTLKVLLENLLRHEDGRLVTAEQVEAVRRWDPASAYVRRPPHLDGMPVQPPPVTTSPGRASWSGWATPSPPTTSPRPGAIPRDSEAGRSLAGLGVPPRQLNTYASHRGNHEVMARGAFANVRLRNQLAPGTVGGVTRCFDAGGELVSIHRAAMTYQEHGTPVVVVAGRDYGAGSSRDWAAKGPKLLGVRAILAESFERIHRSNLVGMGILPLQLLPGQSARSLGLTGEETIIVGGLASAVADPTRRQVEVDADGTTFPARVRLDTGREADYYRHGGVLPFVLRTRLAPMRRP